MAASHPALPAPPAKSEKQPHAKYRYLGNTESESRPRIAIAPERPSLSGAIFIEKGASAQFNLRRDTGASNWAISAVCAALPLKVSTLPSDEIATVSPSLTSPARIISASGSWR